MSGLLEKLKEEHSVIAEILNKVNRVGIGTEDGQNMLFAVKSGLFDHLEKEEQLYSVLIKEAKNDDDLSRILEVFARDMESISKYLFEFFERYSEDSDISPGFVKDYSRLYMALSKRIYREENVIYKRYAELNK